MNGRRLFSNVHVNYFVITITTPGGVSLAGQLSVAAGALPPGVRRTGGGLLEGAARGGGVFGETRQVRVRDGTPLLQDRRSQVGTYGKGQQYVGDALSAPFTLKYYPSDPYQEYPYRLFPARVLRERLLVSGLSKKKERLGSF